MECVWVWGGGVKRERGGVIGVKDLPGARRSHRRKWAEDVAAADDAAGLDLVLAEDGL